MMGGYEVEEGDLPWAVSLHAIYGGIGDKLNHFCMKKSLKNIDLAFCSGTLISRRHVITAAHCFTKYVNVSEEDEECT